MPTYEYLCLKCRHRFDAFQSIKEPPLRQCPKCKGKVQRQIGMGAGIIFKGAGFYATDYKKSSPPPSSEQKPAHKGPEEKKETGKRKD